MCADAFTVGAISMVKFHFQPAPGLKIDLKSSPAPPDHLKAPYSLSRFWILPE